MGQDFLGIQYTRNNVTSAAPKTGIFQSTSTRRKKNTKISTIIFTRHTETKIMSFYALQTRKTRTRLVTYIICAA